MTAGILYGQIVIIIFFNAGRWYNLWYFKYKTIAIVLFSKILFVLIHVPI